MQRNKYVLPNRLFILGLVLEIVFMFTNINSYFQLSGWFLPLLVSALSGIYLNINQLNRIKKRSFLALLLIILLGCSILINNKMLNRGYLISYLLSFILLFQVTELDFSKEDINKIAVAYAISGIIISFMILFFRVKYYALTETRLTIQFMNGPKIDPNYLGGFLTSAATISLLFIERMNKKIIKLLFVFSTILTSFGTILTGSRGAVITLIGCVVLFLVHNNKKLIIRALILFVIIIVVSILFSHFVSSETLERFLNVSKWAQDGSNIRRVSLWANAWNTISKSPILGYGLMGTAEISSSIGNYSQPAHSTYLEMWCQLGIGVLILLAMILFDILKCKNKLSTIILVSTLIPAMFISAECTFYFFFNIAFSAAISNTDDLEERKFLIEMELNKHEKISL